MVIEWLRHRRLAVLLVLVGVILLAAPYLLPAYPTTMLTRILIFAIFAMSLDLQVGYMDYPCFGQAAFGGVAGYITGLLTTRVITSGPGTFWLGMPAGILAAVVIAAIFGLVVFRTKGISFFMVTLAMGMVFYAIAWQWRSMTRGDDGLSGIPRPNLGLPVSMENDAYFYYLVLLFFALTFYLLSRIVRSHFGHALVGIRENEPRMNALGYNVWNYKYLCFILSAAFAGVAGVLYVYFYGFISPPSLHIAVSALVFFMVIIGGSGTLFGPVIGAAIITLLEYVVSMYTEFSVAILGVVFVLSIMFASKGVGGYLVGRWNTLKIGL